MKPMLTAGRVSLMLLNLVVLAPSAVMGADETFRLSAPRYWLDTWAIPSGISLAGDADGDGRAELVAVDPAGTIAVARTSPLGKWVEDPERQTRFGNNLVAAAVGRFMGGAGDQVVALGRDGALLMASGVKRGTSTYSRSDRVGAVSPSAVPSSITRGFSTDLNHDGRLDVLFPRGDGQLLLLLNQPGDEGRPSFVASLARARRPTLWSWESASSARRRATGWSGSTHRETFSRPRSRSAVTTSRWGRPSACSKLVLRRISRSVDSLVVQRTTSSPAAGFCLGAIPRHPSSSTRFPPRLSGSASFGGASVTSTAMAWTTSSASKISPVTRVGRKYCCQRIRQTLSPAPPHRRCAHDVLRRRGRPGLLGRRAQWCERQVPSGPPHPRRDVARVWTRARPGPRRVPAAQLPDL